MTYVYWTHKNGRTYRRRVDEKDWTVPTNCVRFQFVLVAPNAGASDGE